MQSSKRQQPSGTTRPGSAGESQVAPTPASRRRRLETEDTPQTLGNTSNVSRDLTGRRRRIAIYQGLAHTFPKHIVRKIVQYVRETHCEQGSCRCGIWYNCTTCGDQHCSLTRGTKFLTCDECSLPFCKEIYCGYYTDNVRGYGFDLCLSCWDADIDTEDFTDNVFWEQFWANNNQ